MKERGQGKKGQQYFTRTQDTPAPENSASSILNIKYDPKFEQYYEKDYKNSGITLPFSKYIGPGNSLNLGEPKTDADQRAKLHDLKYAYFTYKYANKKINKSVYASLIDKADKEFIKDNDWYTPQGLSGILGIGAKQGAEGLLNQLYPSTQQDKSQFSTKENNPVIVPLASNNQLAHNKYWENEFSSMSRPSTSQQGGPPAKQRVTFNEYKSRVPKGEADLPEGSKSGEDLGAVQDIEMALTGTGKEQASGGASSDGMELYTIERPLSIFGSNDSSYTKVHKFMTFGFADKILLQGVAADGRFFLTSYLAEIPWHIPALYLNQSEFDLLPPGTHVTGISISVVYRGSTIQFETAASTTGLATLNQINDIGIANGLNRTGWGSNISYTSFDATQPMIPSGIARPKYDVVGATYRGMIRDYYGSANSSANFSNDIPKHQTGRQTFLYNYWATTTRSADTGVPVDARMNGGWPCISEKVQQMDGKTAVNSVVCESSYKPKLGCLKAPLTMAAHGIPFTAGAGLQNISVGGSLVSGRVCSLTNQSNSGGLTQTSTEVVGSMSNFNGVPTFGLYTPIEKSQIGRTGYWGEADAHIQPSIHIGVQPVPALSSAATLIGNEVFNSWTDTRAYWEVTATMHTSVVNPTAWPYAPNANVPFGDVISWYPNANRPAAIIDPTNDGATMGGLYTNLSVF